MRPYIIENVTLNDLTDCRQEFAELYKKYGVVIFPGLLKGQSFFEQYLENLRFVFRKILARHRVEPKGTEDLGELLVLLDKVRAMDGKIITDLGTQNNKFFSFNQLKYSDFVAGVLAAIFPDDAVPATPQSGDTLHFFAPGEKYRPYNLPIHQDYQYLMQSPEQVTFYLGLSAYHEGVGGLNFWEGSHKLGVLACGKNKHGAFEVTDGLKLMEGFTEVSHHWNPGDFAFFDSLLCHRSIPNQTTQHGRVVEIFRFSNLNNPTAEEYNWYSTAYNNRRGVEFVSECPELFTGGKHHP